jgi:RNA-directed DNA polymerase
MPLLLSKNKKRTALLRKLKEIFRASRSQPVREVIEKINPILRGWVKYFAVGHSSRCFSFIRQWVEKKIRRHQARARQRGGSGGSDGAGNGCMARWASSRSTVYRIKAQTL